jgi:hypothetical protein
MWIYVLIPKDLVGFIVNKWVENMTPDITIYGMSLDVGFSVYS